eukprot:GFKZ01008755.1.p1 GENE.GFKZ01008755.1~~GFKZ01008755.1.p1  ORF type:complete len:112 (-),score=1.50 GFKZ01008755.1:142-477(-)
MKRTVARAVASAADKKKWRDLAFRQKLAAIPGDALPGRSRLRWTFVPLAFDSLATPSETMPKVIDEYAEAVAIRSGCLTGKVNTRLRQRLSYAILSMCSCAASTICRARYV